MKNKRFTIVFRNLLLLLVLLFFSSTSEKMSFISIHQVVNAAPPPLGKRLKKKAVNVAPPPLGKRLKKIEREVDKIIKKLGKLKATEEKNNALRQLANKAFTLINKIQGQLSNVAQYLQEICPGRKDIPLQRYCKEPQKGYSGRTYAKNLEKDSNSYLIERDQLQIRFLRQGIPTAVHPKNPSATSRAGRLKRIESKVREIVKRIDILIKAEKENKELRMLVKDMFFLVNGTLGQLTNGVQYLNGVCSGKDELYKRYCTEAQQKYYNLTHAEKLKEDSEKYSEKLTELRKRFERFKPQGN